MRHRDLASNRKIKQGINLLKGKLWALGCDSHSLGDNAMLKLSTYQIKFILNVTCE